MTQRMDYVHAAPTGMKALGSVHGYLQQSGLPTALIDLVTCASPRSTATPTASICIRVTC